MAKAIRITAEETRQKVLAGQALLVCAYDTEEQFRGMQLDGAISLPAFKAKLPALAKEQEIILYCA